jgi:Na+/proline symporter
MVTGAGMDGEKKHSSSAWIGGAILIALGLIFLLQGMGYSLPANWWAIFIAVPAVGALFSAWRRYQRDGKFAGPGLGALVSGVILAILAIALFFDVNLGAIWPILLILLGIVVIAGNYWRSG